MDFDGEQNSVPGRLPDFGAIFMSNSATKRECFRRKILGLPSSQAYFVKQVKAGMVLFLFEFERRELYGVFQASSDGAMNIVPHAFRSSGKQFPAQVKFTTVWHCSPLSEHEFCDTIKDNYFSANKFNFGLSKDQVHQLLLLFSSRKSRDLLPQRQLTRSKVGKLSANSFGRVRRVADDDKFVLSDRTRSKHDVDNDLGPVISSEYPWDHLGKEERLHVDGRFATTDGDVNKHDVDNDLGPVISTKYSGNSLDKVRRVVNDRVENEHNVDTGLGPVNSTEYPGLYQFHLNPSVYSSKPILETSNSLIQDQLMPSALPCFMEPQILNLSHSTSHGDAIVSSLSPYDPDAPSIEYRRRSSSFRVNHSSNSVKESDSPSNSSVGNILPSSQNKSFQFFVEPKSKSKNPDVTFGDENYIPLLTPNHCKCSNCMISIPFSKAGFSENRAVDSTDFEGRKDLSLSKLSLAPIPILRSGNYGCEIMNPLAYSSSPSKSPFLVSDYEYRKVSQYTNECKTSWHESNEALTANFHESNSLNRDIEYHRESEGLYSDFQKKRNSVFSRLSLVPEIFEQESDTSLGYDESHMDTSVEGVMDMVHQGHFYWLKKMRNSILSIRQHDDAEKFRNKKQTTFYSHTVRGHSLMIPEEMDMDGSLGCEENCNTMAEGTLLLDFKRRSEVRKIKDGTRKRECVSSAETQGSLGMLPKRRKLVRPNFSNSETSSEKGVSCNNSPNPKGSSQESSVNENIIGNSESLARSRENENKLSLYIGLKHVLCQNDCEGNNTDVHGSSNLEGERKAENFEASFRSGGEDGKELVQDVATEYVLFSDSCKDDSHNAAEGLGIKDSVVDGLSQDYNNTDISNVQESTPGCEGDSQSGMTFIDIDGGGNNENLFRVPICCETAIGKTKNSSSNQGLKLERALKELVDIGVNGEEGEGNKQQLSLGSGAEQSKASFETVSCFDMLE